jgi:hypothetical protein
MKSSELHSQQVYWNIRIFLRSQKELQYGRHQITALNNNVKADKPLVRNSLNE